VIPAAIEGGTRGVRPLGQRAVCAWSRTIALIWTPARIRLWTGWLQTPVRRRSRASHSLPCGDRQYRPDDRSQPVDRGSV